MATDLGKAYVQIVPSARGIGSSMASALNPAAASAGKSAGTTISQNMGQRISSVGKNFIKAGAIATAVSVPIINGIKDALSAYEVQATAETKLTEIYKTRMGASDKAAKSTMNLASELQKQGVIGDEVALSGAQQLATFAKYPSTINTLLPAMNNLLAQQKGVNATTDDAVNIGNLMGKVLQGQTGALKRVGISFTDAQEQVLKYGTEEEKAAMLSEVITSNVGNMNSALAQTPAGKMAQLSNSMGDLKEQVGAALAPALAQLAQYASEKLVPLLEKIIGFLQDHPVIAKIVIGLTGLLAVGGPLLIMLGTLMTVLPAIGGAFSVLLGPVGLVIAAIAAAIAIGVALYKNWDVIKKKILAIWQALIQKVAALKHSITTAFSNMGTAIKSIVSKWLSVITWPFKKAWEFIKGVADKIKSVFSFDFSLPHIKLPHFSIHPKGWHFSDLLEGSIPSLGIDWYAKGGIVDRPTVIGAGDVRGGEGIVPLTQFWNQMDAMADSIVGGLATVAAGSGGGGDIHLDIYLYPSGPKMGEETVRAYDTYKKILG